VSDSASTGGGPPSVPTAQELNGAALDEPPSSSEITSSQTHTDVQPSLTSSQSDSKSSLPDAQTELMLGLPADDTDWDYVTSRMQILAKPKSFKLFSRRDADEP